MLRKREGEVEWLEFESLQAYPELKHGIFLQGSSRPEILQVMGCEKFAECHQKHGDTIVIDPSGARESDGLCTSLRALPLLIKHADCQAAIFYDPMKRVIGNVHAGWRGSVQNIYAKMVKSLEEHFGSRPEDLRVCIGPSLGPCCAEFINYEKELPSSFWAHEVRPTYFDFWSITRSQLKECGVSMCHVEVAEMCTVCSPEKFHSYRRNKTQERLATVVVQM